MRIFTFVVSTKSRKIKFRSDANLELKAYSDTSHMLYRRKMTWSNYHYGDIVVTTKSFRMKLVTKSSTELELVARRIGMYYGYLISCETSV